MPKQSLRPYLLALASSVLVTLLLVSTRAAVPPPQATATTGTAPAPAPQVARPFLATSAPAAQLAEKAARPVGPIVAFGDSVTYGYGSGVTYDFFGPAPAHSYPWDLERLLGRPVINAGISGDSAHMALYPDTPDGHRPPPLRIPALLAQHPSLVIVGFGGKEAFWGVPVATAAADLDAVLTAFDGIPTVIVASHVDCSLYPCAHPGEPYTTAWDARLRAIAARHHAGLVTDVLHGLAAAGMMNTGPNHDLRDGLHPNAQGYAVMASRVAVAVRQRLASAS